MPEVCEHAQTALNLPPQVAEARREIPQIIGQLLTEVVPPAIERLADSVEVGPEGIREHAYSIPIDKISNPTAHLMALGKDGELPRIPEPDPSDESNEALRRAFTELSDNWYQSHLDHSREVPGMHADTELARELTMRGIYLWRKTGGQVDSESWKVNQAAFRRQLDRKYETLCQAAFNMCRDYGNPFNKKFRGFDYLTETADESLIAATGITNHNTMQVRAPFGYYGKQSAVDSLRATILMMHHLWRDPQLREDIKQRLYNPDYPANDARHYTRFYHVFKHHTLRAMGARYGALEQSIIGGAVDGVISVHAARHLRTIVADPAYPHKSDYYDLVEAMAEQDTAKGDTQRASLSLAGLSERQGRYMLGLMGTTTTPEARKTLARIRRHATTVIDEEWAEFGEQYARAQKKHGWHDYYEYLELLSKQEAVEAYDPQLESIRTGAGIRVSDDAIPRPPVRVGRICPATGRNEDDLNPITTMERAFPMLLQCVREQPRRPVEEVAVPRHAFERYPIGVAAQ
jgi:hypothetical protein